MDRIDAKRVQVFDALEALHAGQGDGQLTVRQIMTTELSCVAPDCSVVELVRLFHAKAFRHLLVTDSNERLLGVISDRDVLRCLGPHGTPSEALSKILASELMSTDLLTVSSRTPVTQAIDILIDQGISSLPVVDGGKLVGIFTNTDLHVVLQLLLQTIRLTGSADSAIAAGK